MKTIICLLLIISIQAYANSDNIKNCEFFNKVTMDGCRDLTNGLFGKENEQSASSAQIVSKCFIITISEYIKSGDHFTAQWNKMSLKEKKERIESLSDKFKEKNTKKHNSEIDSYMKKCTAEYKKVIDKPSSKDAVTKLSYSEFKKMAALGMPPGKIYSVFGRLFKRGGYICEDSEYTRTYDCQISEAVSIFDDFLSPAKKSQFYDLRDKYLCFYVQSEGEYITIKDFNLGPCKK